VKIRAFDQRCGGIEVIQHHIEKLEDLAIDLAARHRSLKPGQNRSSPEIDRDFESLMREGYVIIENLLSEEQLEHIRSECMPLLEKRGRNNFEGLKTQRVYDVFSKTRAIDRLADHPRILGLIDKVLMPNYLLSQAQIINILPDEDPQLLHMDDGNYPIPRPRPPLGTATVWAIDDFTQTNGATAIIPGSHHWGEERHGANGETIPAVMSAGSVVVYLASTWHGGGKNQSSSSRLGVTCQYCQPYLRQQENFPLELSPELVRGLSPELQSLVGYSILPPFFGMVDGKHPRRLLVNK
jgi:Phytanoyl-CoA dioxygenase (PhyH)